jgi:hypothetical protein
MGSLAPVLFNTFVDVFSRMLVKGYEDGLVKWLWYDIISGGIVSLQYADNTLSSYKMIIVHINFKWILTCFEQLSGMHIDYNRCDLVRITWRKHYLSWKSFRVRKGNSLSSTWVGKFKREVWEDKIILVQTVLSTIPIYMLSFFKFSKWPLKLIKTKLDNYLWSAWK